MDSFEKLITPWAGPWTALILVIVALAVWALNRIPGWLASRTGAVRGSPSSARYWRARFAEALAQHDKEVGDLERDQLAARVTEARIMVEAHEATRRVGMGGIAPFWTLVIFFALAAAITGTAAIVKGSWPAALTGLAFTVLMIGTEILALLLTSASHERFNVLVAAGRFGRSDLVREDPWRVLREYDYAAARAGRRERLKARAAADREASTRWTRFERSMLGVSAYQNGIGIAASEIWSPLAPSDPDGSSAPETPGSSGG